MTSEKRSDLLKTESESVLCFSGMNESPVTAQLFGNAGIEHMKKYGTKPEHFAKIAYKNHLHSVNNPYSQFQDRYTLEQIMNSPKVFGPLTKLQCCPTSDGGAAVVLANEDFVRRHNLEAQAVEIVAMEMATDTATTFAERSCMKLVGLVHFDPFHIMQCYCTQSSLLGWGFQPSEATSQFFKIIFFIPWINSIVTIYKTDVIVRIILASISEGDTHVQYSVQLYDIMP